MNKKHDLDYAVCVLKYHMSGDIDADTILDMYERNVETFNRCYSALDYTLAVAIRAIEEVKI